MKKNYFKKITYKKNYLKKINYKKNFLKKTLYRYAQKKKVRFESSDSNRTFYIDIFIRKKFGLRVGTQTELFT